MPRHGIGGRLKEQRVDGAEGHPTATQRAGAQLPSEPRAQQRVHVARGGARGDPLSALTIVRDHDVGVGHGRGRGARAAADEPHATRASQPAVWRHPHVLAHIEADRCPRGKGGHPFGRADAADVARRVRTGGARREGAALKRTDAIVAPPAHSALLFQSAKHIRKLGGRRARILHGMVDDSTAPQAGGGATTGGALARVIHDARDAQLLQPTRAAQSRDPAADHRDRALAHPVRRFSEVSRGRRPRARTAAPCTRRHWRLFATASATFAVSGANPRGHGARCQ